MKSSTRVNAPVTTEGSDLMFRLASFLGPEPSSRLLLVLGAGVVWFLMRNFDA